MPGFADRLRALRTNHGFSQQKLADKLGISKSSVNMYERGSREPGLDMLEAIADLFNVDLDYLMGKTDVPRRPIFLDDQPLDLQLFGSGEPSATSKPAISDEDIKFALFGGEGDITDEMFDEVKKFAAYIKARDSK